MFDVLVRCLADGHRAEWENSMQSLSQSPSRGSTLSSTLSFSARDSKVWLGGPILGRPRLHEGWQAWVAEAC